MNALTDRAELIELLSRYADIADLRDFTDLPGRVSPIRSRSTSSPWPGCRR